MNTASALVLVALTGACFCQEPPYPVDVTAETLGSLDEMARLQTPGRVLLNDGFEEGLSEAWFGRSGEAQGLVKVVDDRDVAHSGERSLRMDAEDRGGDECAAGAHYWLDPGHDVVYFRRYIKFAADYHQGNLHHVGGSLYAVAGSDRWGGMGKAGIRPVGDDRFGAGFEPWIHWGRVAPPGAMMLYTYWMDMKGGNDDKYYGNNLMPPDEAQVVLERDRWHCLEHMISANSPGEADGEMAAWIDGGLYLHLTGFRWRSTPEVKLRRASLGLYIHSSERANTVWYDDVALSTGYLGPTR